MRGPRVLHVITDDNRRGAQVAAFELHNELVKRGWDSHVVALAPGLPGGLDVAVLGASPKRPSTMLALRRRAGDADVVVAHGSTTVAACAASLVGSTPFIFVSIGDPRAWAASQARRCRVKLYAQRAQAVVAICASMKGALVEHLGVASEKIEVLPNFRNPSVYKPAHADTRHAIRRELGWPEYRPVVLWMGALTHEKRPDLAVKVAAKMPGVHFAIVGDGPLSSEIGHDAEESGAQLMGSVAEPWRLLSAADVFLLTSDTEGLPGVLIEAGLSGLPIVASNVGFASDAVWDGVNGLLVPPGESAALANGIHECLRGTFPERALADRARFELDFGSETIVPLWERLLGEVVKQHRGSVLDRSAQRRPRKEGRP